ncbi:MAG: DUF1049 domain-containing protein [Acaryochloridaceae cyanobacterium RU_4_10]|nr:DUF1049 domain-containing protein [Acaryochloridaceae cyanobacterium RU_4_10]
MKVLAFLIIGLAIVGAALFSVQNATSVSIQFLSWRSIELPLGLILILSFTVGLLLAVILPLVWRFAAARDEPDKVSFADRDRTAFNQKATNKDWD